ncbi:tyrosine-type recombinase/integrase [Erythrobacter sp. A6_0]|uniref:tyrosine-type recombinase/integrase n=1 Tax=Erythrobacter sp. A6_0 TaxID=2821089 RepID=UPI0032AEA8FA
MTGLHVVRKRRAGLDRFYVYAWRGGPCIHVADGLRPTIGPELLDKAAAERIKGSAGGARDLDSLIAAYRASPEYIRLADATKRDYRLWLDRIAARFGTAPLAAFADSRMREHVILWRDTWINQPRTADKAAVMMATLLGWGVDRGILAVNVAAGIKTLHRVNRSKEVWERKHIRAFANKPRHLREALMLAGFTGLRLADLVRVAWENVGPRAIVIERTRKRGGRAVIPLLPETRKLLDRIGRDSGAILRNSRGEPWTESGLGSVFQKAKPAGFDRTIHDLRGTFATRLILSGATDSEAAMVLGWTAKEIAAVRARYVDEERVVIQLADRLTA